MTELSFFEAPGLLSITVAFLTSDVLAELRPDALVSILTMQ